MRRNLFEMSNSEKTRILEMHYKASGKSLLKEQGETTTNPQAQTTMDEPKINSAEDIISIYGKEVFDEFLNDINDEIVAYVNQSEPNTITEGRQIILSENCIAGSGNFMLADCFKGTFKKWLKGKGQEFDYWVSKKFEDWRRNQDPKKKKPKNKGYLQKPWWENKKGSIRIGRKKWLYFGKGKGSRYDEFDSQEYDSPETPEEEWVGFLSNDSRITKLMTKASKTNWNNLKTNNIEYAVAVLERFDNTNEPSAPWTKVGVGIDMQVFKTEIQMDPTVNKTEGDQKEYPFVPITFPFDAEQEPNLFVNNEWDEAAAGVFSAQIDKLVNEVTRILSGLNPPEGKPKGYIQSLDLYSSASRFRNTGEKAEVLSFLELSTNRLNTAQSIIFNKLSAIGVGSDASTKITLNPNGSNGDGTSGPNPPLQYKYVPKGNVKMTPFCESYVQECKIGGKVVKRNELGKPHSNNADYDKYKYVRGTVVIVFNDLLEAIPNITPPDEKKEELEPIVDEIETPVYPVYFFRPGKKPFKIPLPGIIINWHRMRSKNAGLKGAMPEKKPGSTKCEFFGENGK
jgi:hypothetical protein